MLRTHNSASSRMAIITQHYSIPSLQSSSKTERETGLCFTEAAQLRQRGCKCAYVVLGHELVVQVPANTLVREKQASLHSTVMDIYMHTLLKSS